MTCNVFPIVKRRPGYWRYLGLLAACVLTVFLVYFSIHRTYDSYARPRITDLSLSTKTPYPAPTAPVRQAPSHLELVQVQLVSRHGTRYPTLGDMKHIKDIYELSGLNLPHGWIKEELVNPENAGLLAQYGHSEMEGIALRMMQRYSTFLTERLLHPETLRFVSSEFQRSYMSARTFRDVVDPGNLTQPVTVVPLSDDVSLAMKFNCPLWLQDKPAAAHNSSLEVEVFDSIHGQRLRQSIGDRLDIDSSVLKVEGIAMLYSLCGYDLSLFAETNSWCTLFDPDTAALLELRNDIKYSRIYGPYGATTNKKMACSLLTEVFAEMDQALQNQSSAVSTFRFGHAETIMFVSTLLGLEQALGSYNSPIAGAMSPVVALRRGFKTTAIAPFASNLGIELYKDQSAQPYFRLLLNEQAVRLPGCSDEFCSLNVLRTKLGDAIGCDFVGICRV